MFGRDFRMYVGVAGAAVVLPLVAFVMLSTYTQLTAAPHLLGAAVRGTLSSVLIPYLLVSLLAVLSLALMDFLKPTFCITAFLCIIMMAALLITAYNRGEHLDAAACSVNCARHVSNVSSIANLGHAAEGAYCMFIPGSKQHRLSRCFVHDPHLVLHFSNGHYLQVLDVTYALVLVLGLLVLLSAPSSTTRKQSCAL